MKHKGLHIALFVVAVAVLALPAVQQHAKLFELAPLKGVTVGAERPHLNPSTFLSGEYQRQEDQYLTENIGFRELFVRSYNQWSWSLFRQPRLSSPRSQGRSGSRHRAYGTSLLRTG